MTEYRVERVFESVRIVEGVTSSYSAALNKVRRMTSRTGERYEILQTTEQDHIAHMKLVSLLRRLNDAKDALDSAAQVIADFGVYVGDLEKKAIEPDQNGYFVFPESECGK